MDPLRHAEQSNDDNGRATKPLPNLSPSGTGPVSRGQHHLSQQIANLTDGAEGLDIGALGDETAEALGDPGEDEPVTSCGESFTAGTKVLLASGAAVPIASLAPGAKVLATNVKTGKTSAETVRAVMVKQDTDRYNLTIEVEHRPAIIDTTRNHLFYDLTRRQWMKASQLGHGDRLRGAHGESSVVVGGYARGAMTGGCGTCQFREVATTTSISTLSPLPSSSTTARPNIIPSGTWCGNAWPHLSTR
jgi:hypothetical protein